MICKYCKKSIPDAARFCGYCGKSMEARAESGRTLCAQCGTPLKGVFCGNCGARNEYAPDPRQNAARKPKAAKPSKGNPRRERGFHFTVIMLCILLTGVLAGVGMAFYIARNGWESVPFAERLTFLPFVTLDREAVGTYSESDDSDDMDDAKRIGEGDGSEAENAAENESDSGTENGSATILHMNETQTADADIIGYWICETRDDVLILRVYSNYTFVLIADDFAADNLSAISHGTIDIYADGGGAALVDIEGGAYDMVVDAEHISVEMDERTLTFTRPEDGAASILGFWKSTQDKLFYEFASDGSLRVWTMNYGGPPDDVEDELAYRYEPDANSLTIVFEDSQEQNEAEVDILNNEYMILHDPEAPTTAAIFKRYSDGAPQPAVPLANSDYILPNSDSEMLDVGDLLALTPEVLRIARNEILARHGRLFESEDLREYFEAKSWYSGRIAPNDFVWDVLSKIEQDNITLIKEVEALYQ